MALLFESETCPRCGGSGRYSYNQIHGSRCYGCNGKGERLTKRGSAAQKYLNDLRAVPVRDLGVGDRYYDDGSGIFNPGWVHITAVTRTAEGHLRLIDRNGRARVWEQDDRLVRKGYDDETAEAMRQQALAYQATLTKSGTVSRRVRK